MSTKRFATQLTLALVFAAAASVGAAQRLGGSLKRSFSCYVALLLRRVTGDGTDLAVRLETCLAIVGTATFYCHSCARLSPLRKQGQESRVVSPAIYCRVV